MSNFTNINVPPSRLRRVTVEVTTWCNLACPGCIRTVGEAQGTWTNRHIDRDLFAQIIDNLPQIELLVMHGIGEPLLHPHYPDLVEYAHKSGKIGKIICNSNALARSVDVYKTLVEIGLSSFSISVDSLNSAISERTRTGTNVEKLKRRLRLISEQDLPFTITMVASKLNLHDIPSTLMQLREITDRPILIQCYIDHGGGDFGLSQDEAAYLEQAISGFIQLNPKGRVHFANSYKQSASDLPMCVAPWFDPGITSEGYLTPCCVEWDPSVLGMINMGETRWDEVWSSPSMQSFISDYRLRSPAFCYSCSEDVRAIRKLMAGR